MRKKMRKKWVLRVFGVDADPWCEASFANGNKRKATFGSLLILLQYFASRFVSKPVFLQTGLVQTGLYPVNRFARTGYKPV